MRPLRIAHLTTFYPPHNFGGDGIGIQRLCRGLARAGHHNVVIHCQDAFETLHSGPEPKDLGEPEGIERIPLRSKYGTLSNLLTQQTGRPIVHGKRIRRLLDEGNFDVINFHNSSLIGGPGLWSYGDAVKLCLAHEHWLVCESHVLWRHGKERCDEKQCLRCVLHHKRPPQLWRRTNLIGRKGREVDTFVAMSEFSRGKHREFGFPFEMEVLPYFLPDPEPDEPRELRSPTGGSPHERPYFLFVGRLEKIKGLDDVIPAFAGEGDADLLIAGDGEYRAELERQAKGHPRVRFLGRVEVDALSRYYAHARALIVPSVCFETFGIILIEAFRQGTPVIARRIGPFPEIVETARAGDLFGTNEELVQAIARVTSDPALRDERARNARAAYLEHWCESAVIPRYLDLVRRAAERKNDRRVLDAMAPMKDAG